MYADALDGDAVAQCRLEPKPHLQLHPDLRPALVCVVGRDAERLRSTPHRCPKLPIAVRPPPPKSPGDSS